MEYGVIKNEDRIIVLIKLIREKDALGEAMYEYTSKSEKQI